MSQSVLPAFQNKRLTGHIRNCINGIKINQCFQGKKPLESELSHVSVQIPEDASHLVVFWNFVLIWGFPVLSRGYTHDTTEASYETAVIIVSDRNANVFDGHRSIRQ